MEDFNWAVEIEEVEYYVIDSHAYNSSPISGPDMEPDEWVLIQITGRDEVNVYYRIVHYNLRHDVDFSAPYEDTWVTHHWFDELISTGYWKRHYTKPTPTLFDHKNNQILKKLYEKN
jgi:hypothetical protein